MVVVVGQKLDELAVRDMMVTRGDHTLGHDVGEIFKNAYQLFVLPKRGPAKLISTRLICTGRIESITVASLALVEQVAKKLEPIKRPFNAK